MTAAERDAAEVLSFAYHRSLSPGIAMLLGLAMAETVVVHLVAVALWGWAVAVALGLLDVTLVVLLVALLRSFRRRPVEVGGGRLTMRAGFLKALTVPLADVAGLRAGFTAADLADRTVLNLALAGHPNVVVDLARPVPGRGSRRIGAIAHRLDDPVGFARALAR